MKVVSIAGWKNSGKTGLAERLVGEFCRRGLKVATVKHAHHDFEIDRAGSDSFRHRAAGAGEVLIMSSRRWALIHENAHEAPPDGPALDKLHPADIVIVEGFKSSDLPKIETRRHAAGGRRLAPEDRHVICVASDRPAKASTPPEFDLNDTASIAGFILREVADFDRRTAKPDLDRSGLSAMPPGTDWMPVDEALSRLEQSVCAVTGEEIVDLAAAEGRILAQPVPVLRSSPPAMNSAVDGYGFRYADLEGESCRLALNEGRAAPGAPAIDRVPAGHAVRILTGAVLPEGVDTVMLDELAELSSGAVTFRKPSRPGLNTRKRGEDLRRGEPLFAAGRLVRSSDVASLAAAGHTRLPVRARLKVAVISTGDELVSTIGDASGNAVLDANRPMLLTLLSRWGYVGKDLGLAGDTGEAVRDALDKASQEADAILISGGASAGDEDHVSQLLTTEGEIQAWRIAVKPGRPLALAKWCGRPVFGLPGNPVAAFVCTLIFARPALNVLAGGGWHPPTGFMVPAAFSKRKKAGRREFIRARMNPDGGAEAFHSEGSGLTSGLAWSDGLVELEDGARDIGPGDMVRYIPYSSFGI
ncbi:MAG: bifunctional molybdopterin-guanine dinucleotide biosynthesis adaptor protein MobB/molybdopterin molybdotransferase MoeA [Rhodobacteraceae bacterium]|nr:bifunctional molybdopterin-guanine dinucleotide biosynthesis adaptor protein MobB/molybdopterin molybdotransferase MoeA [Paracoccaceae bacterium]